MPTNRGGWSIVKRTCWYLTGKTHGSVDIREMYYNFNVLYLETFIFAKNARANTLGQHLTGPDLAGFSTSVYACTLC